MADAASGMRDPWVQSGAVRRSYCNAWGDFFGRPGWTFAGVLGTRWAHPLGRGHREGLQDREWGKSARRGAGWTGSGHRGRNLVRQFGVCILRSRSGQRAAGIFRGGEMRIAPDKLPSRNRRTDNMGKRDPAAKKETFG